MYRIQWNNRIKSTVAYDNHLHRPPPPLLRLRTSPWPQAPNSKFVQMKRFTKI